MAHSELVEPSTVVVVVAENKDESEVVLDGTDEVVIVDGHTMPDRDDVKKV